MHIDTVCRGPGELPQLRARAAAGLRADHSWLEQHENNPGWALTCPITALAGSSDPTLADADLEEWAIETARDFATERPPGGSAYLLEPTGRAHLAKLVLEAIAAPHAPIPDTIELPDVDVAAKARARAKQIRDQNPWALDIDD